MTYNQLIEILSKLSPEQRNTDVITYHKADDEYYPIHLVELSDEDCVLDAGHPILVHTILDD